MTMNNLIRDTKANRALVETGAKDKTIREHFLDDIEEACRSLMLGDAVEACHRAVKSGVISAWRLNIGVTHGARRCWLVAGEDSERHDDRWVQFANDLQRLSVRHIEVWNNSGTVSMVSNDIPLDEFAKWNDSRAKRLA